MTSVATVRYRDGREAHFPLHYETLMVAGERKGQGIAGQILDIQGHAVTASASGDDGGRGMEPFYAYAAAQYVTATSGCLAALDNEGAFIHACETLHACFREAPKAYELMRDASRQRSLGESWPVVVQQFESMPLDIARQG